MFKSNSSKSHSINLLNKLTASIQNDTSSKTPTSSTEVLASQFTAPKTKKIVKKQNKKIQKNQKRELKELKRVKYELIKNKDNLSPEHEKYLKKLIKKNKNLILSNDGDEDYSTEELQKQILSFNKKEVKKNKNFKTKKHTGLTPGLAPVDYESDSE